MKTFRNHTDAFADKLTNIVTHSILSCSFPDKLRCADISPAFKKGDKFDKENYRPVSLRPTASKVFERILFSQIQNYIENYLSNYLCGFRKGHSPQHCLLVMVKNMRRCIDSKRTAAALLTDLSKSFDCINHRLLIAKLNTYGFGYNALKLIFDYLSRRRQRVKINDTLSKWSNIACGVPQGSILGPLLFNIFINDILYFMNNTKITNYADDNTPYICDINIDIALNILESDGNTIFNWFAENFLKANANKSHLIVTKKPEGFSVTIGNDTISCSAEEKLLGIYIDYELKFENHVNTYVKKLIKSYWLCPELLLS